MALARTFGSLALVAVATTPLLSQPAQSGVRQPATQAPVFRAGTELVEVDVIARDKAGDFVSDLAAEDFELQEDGKPFSVQQILLRLAAPAGWNDSRRPSTAPHIFLVVFDDAHLSAAGFRRTQAAALTLFQTQMRDGDIGGVVANGRTANNRLTSDRAELVKAVKDAKPSGKVQSAEMDERIWPRLSAVEAVRIAVNDDKEMMDAATRRGCDEQKGVCDGPAGDDVVRSMLFGKASQLSSNVRVEATRTLTMLRSVLTGLARLNGPKSLLLMSEGFISEETWPDVQETVASAARSDVRIYTLDARGLARGLVSTDSVAPTEGISRMFEQMDLAADSVNSLAVDTGGFVVRNTNQFDGAIARIADDAGNYYVLGYLPPSPGDGKFHKIRVTVKRPGVSVRARRGYVAVRLKPDTTGSATETPVRLKPDTTSDTTGSTTETPVVSGFSRTAGDPSLEAPAAATVIAPEPGAAPTDGRRLRPDASKHIDLLLPDPSADRAAAAGWEAYQRGDLESARASLSVAAASPAAEAWVHYALGMSEYALGKYANAVSEWEKVRRVTTTFEPVYFDLVDGYLQLKEHDKSVRLLREGASRWPQDPDIFNALGVVYTVRGALPEAIQAFQDAIAAAPNEAVSYFNLGRAHELRYFKTRRYVRQTKRWITDEKDRTAAIESYERYLGFGGPYADAAREGVTRLKWAAAPP